MRKPLDLPKWVYVLNALGESTGYLSTREISQRTKIPSYTLCSVMKQMLAIKLVKKVVGDNHRVNYYELTGQGLNWCGPFKKAIEAENGIV